MDWQDQGFVLAARRHGETSAIVELFTEEHGRHAGVVRGATSRKTAPTLQPGTQVAATWRARLEDHLGSFALEPIQARAAAMMADRASLAGLNAITALLHFMLPERESHPRLYLHSLALLDLIVEGKPWFLSYLHWELALLEEMGFGLDLTECAVTGAQDDLAYVSPKTGRAVSNSGAGEWKDRLLPLPGCLMGRPPADTAEILRGLRTTGHFLKAHLAPALGDRPLPVSRQRLIDLLGRQS